MKCVPVIHVTLLPPSFTASEFEQVICTTVPGFTGNCFVVSIVLVHSVFNPVQAGAARVLIQSDSDYFELLTALGIGILHLAFRNDYPYH